MWRLLVSLNFHDLSQTLLFLLVYIIFKYNSTSELKFHSDLCSGLLNSKQADPIESACLSVINAIIFMVYPSDAY